jgi:predicted RNase H-like HicB family nuclease
MELKTYHVHAEWDPTTRVWIATSDDVPGLTAEAQTTETLVTTLRRIIPELLEVNGLLPDHSIAFEMTSHRRELVDDQPNQGLVDWLLSCPEKDFFVPLETEFLNRR